MSDEKLGNLAFYTRVLTHIESLKPLARPALLQLTLQYFKVQPDKDEDEITLQRAIGIKLAADDARRVGEDVPSNALLVLSLLGERECLPQELQ